MLTKEQIIALTPATEELEIPGAGKILIRGMTGAERLDFEAAAFPEGDKVDTKAFKGYIVYCCVTDAKGNKVFESPESALMLPDNIVSRIIPVAQRLCGLGAAQQEEIEKN